jgi:hypothetical protein
LPFGQGNVLRIAAGEQPGIVQVQVERPERGFGGVDCRQNRGLVGDVAGEGDRFAATCAEQFGGRFGTVP